MPELIYLNDAVTVLLKEQEDDIEAYSCAIPECFDGDRAVEVITKLPTIDLIHCSDCRFRYGSSCTRFAEIPVTPEDYCSRGKKK